MKRKQKTSSLAGADVNGHHTVSRNSDINELGEFMLQFLFNINLYLSVSKGTNLRTNNQNVLYVMLYTLKLVIAVCILTTNTSVLMWHS